MNTSAILNHLDSQFDASVERLSDWLRIPSVSTDPAFKPDCRRAAQWLADDLKSIGFTASLRDTKGHPVVFAHHPGPKGYEGPHLLFYGHYDVQPPDPLELWDSPPFEPEIVEGPHGQRIVARGAVDDKGQVMTFVEACRAWNEAGGGVPCRITCVIEGEEECGSVNLHEFLKQSRDELVGRDAPGSPCDFAVVSDTGMWDVNTPAITYSLRGLVYLEVFLYGPSRDLHSGLYGGCVPNPINELARIIGLLHDGDRRITLPGFYDDVLPLTKQERQAWAALDFDERAFLDEAGLSQGYGEAGYSLLERQWGRPTCDVNGIKGGYIGQGAKTVISSSASAKISFRLVPDQDPKKITAAFRKWIESQLAPGCRVEVVDHGIGRPCLTPIDHPAMAAARAALKEAMGREAVLIRSGGSIPIVEGFKSVLGLETLLIGFGLNDDRVHSPNEKFELACFRNGQRSHAVLLQRLAALKGR
ncbi:MAG: dipeptidase [Phycisphaerales bacterium]|nr:dipeptidase [Phycisphaerales bacterium]